MSKQYLDDDWIAEGAPIPRVRSYEPISDGWLTIVWESGNTARLRVSSALAAASHVEFLFDRDGVLAGRCERTFRESFDGTLEPTGWGAFLEELAVSQGQPSG
ncbi:hypothetical protein GHV40_14180 [Devosia sp. D6-9]|nr:hypothetical protein GHV40_14180 [Devosia sp. D6-9]